MLNRIASAKAKILRRMSRYRSPISSEHLRRSLGKVISETPEILFVHSSLSSCGYFIGGPARALDVLREFCGTLVLPTHTYSYPASPGEPAPLFDAVTTPSEMGLLAETFRKQPGVVRSIHSTHSLAAQGPLATELCSGHYLHDTPCGAGTPYDRMVRRRAAVLMFGVSFAYYTFFHTAEWLSGSDAAYEPDEENMLRFRDDFGHEAVHRSKRQGRALPRFDKAGFLLEREGFVRRIGLGQSHLLYVPDSLAVHQFLVERLRKTPDFLRAACTAPLN
jgi:aminoglycoside 3-N-acetyltransferase